MVISIHFFDDFAYKLVILGQDPSIQLRSLIVIYKKGSGIDAVSIGVKHEEVVNVSQGFEELAYYLLQPVLVKPGRSPGRRGMQQIPPGRICAVLVKEFEGIHRIAPGL